jgi:hypothetical protein
MTRKTSKSPGPSQKPLKQFGKSTACDRNSDQIKDGCAAAMAAGFEYSERFLTFAIGEQIANLKD